MIQLWVSGIPVPQGSKTAFRNKSTGKLMVLDSAQGLAPWRAEVKRQVTEQWLAQDKPVVIFEKPIGISLAFVLPRLKGHYGTGRNAGVLKPNAPSLHVTKPDIDKLTRAVLDSLTGTVFFDDSQVALLRATKRYGTAPGVSIQVQVLEGIGHEGSD